MKMILTSCDFRNDLARKVILDNLPKTIDKCKLLFIPNEKADYQAIHSEKFYSRMREFGFSRENITVFDYYEPSKYFGLDIDVLYVSGGNTFKTLERIRKSGFDKEIVRYVKSGVTYVGGSAGAHIVTSDISHVKKYDDLPSDMTDFSGLALFDGIIICHFTPERRDHYNALVSEGKHKVYALTDDDSLVIDDRSVADTAL